MRCHPTGVRGLMMLTEDTAAYLGIADRTDPTRAFWRRALLPVDTYQDSRSHCRARSTYARSLHTNVGYPDTSKTPAFSRRCIGAIPTRGRTCGRFATARAGVLVHANRAGYARGWEPVRYVDNIRSYLDIRNGCSR